MTPYTRNGSRSDGGGFGGPSFGGPPPRLFFAFAFLERLEIVEDVVADFFEIFGDLRHGVFFLQLLDEAVDQHRGGFLFEVAQFAGQLARKRQRLAVNDGEFLPELFVLALEVFGGNGFELAFVHHLGDVFDRHHLAFEHRENFRQRHGAHLHVAQRKLLARDAPREIVHQFFFADRVAVHDAALLPLEGLALEHLRNAPAQEFDARLHVLLEAVGLAARQREQARAVRVLEIVDVAAVGGRLGARLNSSIMLLDHAAAAGARKAADKNVVSGRRELHAHLAARAKRGPGRRDLRWARPARWCRRGCAPDRSASEAVPAEVPAARVAGFVAMGGVYAALL